MKLFAYYLPQFYPTPENDKYWGVSFTEWVNVKNAKPLFPGHNQPKIPTDFGYYDLRNIEIIKRQAEYARSIKVDGFSFWHYWFGNGKQTLEKPVELLLQNKDVDIEYYFTWVNANWTKSWIGKDKEVIFEQQYNREDYKKHFLYLLPFFSDSRYYKINNKPVFAINEPRSFNLREFMEIMNNMAIDNGFPGMIFISPYIHTKNYQIQSMDYLSGYPPGDYSFGIIEKLKNRLRYIDKLKITDYGSYVHRYKQYIDKMMNNNDFKYIPTLMPNWDNTPRYRNRGWVFKKNEIEIIQDLFDYLYSISLRHERPFMIIKSWNEWAEGNYLEPDLENGQSLGNIIRSVVRDKSKDHNMMP
jgi:hypothetical protein